MVEVKKMGEVIVTATQPTVRLSILHRALIVFLVSAAFVVGSIQIAHAAPSNWVSGSETWCATKGNSTTQHIAWTSPNSSCALQAARHRYTLPGEPTAFWTQWSYETTSQTAVSNQAAFLDLSEHAVQS